MAIVKFVQRVPHMAQVARTHMDSGGARGGLSPPSEPPFSCSTASQLPLIVNIQKAILYKLAKPVCMVSFPIISFPYYNFSFKIDYKEKHFDVIVSSFLQELNWRFSSESCTILTSMAALFPTSPDFLNFEVMRPFVNFYELRSDLLKSECDVFAAQFSKADTNCKNLLQEFLEKHKECYIEWITTCVARS